MATILFFIAAMPGPARLSPELVRMFEAGEYCFESAPGQLETVRYRLFRPAKIANRHYPLIVWLHGLGESGTDNVHQLRWLDALIFTSLNVAEASEFYLLAVQCPKQVPWFLGSDPKGSDCPKDMLDCTRAILEKLAVEYPIDRDRISLAGLSSGGTACWEMYSRYPELFAAVAPLASSVANIEGLPTDSEAKVWAFHSTFERFPSPRAARGAVMRIGRNAHLTEIASDQHECWREAFGDYGLLEWLLSQRRGMESAWFEDFLSWVARSSRHTANGWDATDILKQLWVMALAIAVISRGMTRLKRAFGSSPPERNGL